MKQNATYHIDVTEEEAQLFAEPIPELKNNSLKTKLKSIAFNKVFCLVLGLHVAAAAALFAVSPSPKSQQPNEETSTREEVQQKDTHQPVEIKPIPKQCTSLTETYTVKQGDTLYSIARKYKLNINVLIKLNNIKDVTKLQVGQTLKFVNVKKS